METLQFLEETASAEPSGTKSARAQRREDHLCIKDRISTELKKKKVFSVFSAKTCIIKLCAGEEEEEEEEDGDGGVAVILRVG